jgi:hypothetical protein
MPQDAENSNDTEAAVKNLISRLDDIKKKNTEIAKQEANARTEIAKTLAERIFRIAIEYLAASDKKTTVEFAAQYGYYYVAINGNMKETMPLTLEEITTLNSSYNAKIGENIRRLIEVNELTRYIAFHNSEYNCHGRYQFISQL